MDYQDVKKIAAKTARDVKRKSQNMYSSAKISVSISKKESEIEEKLLEIGNLVYSAHEGIEEAAGGRVSVICSEIDELKAEIKELKIKKELLKSDKKCEVCGCKLHPEEKTCPNCGCEVW